MTGPIESTGMGYSAVYQQGNKKLSGAPKTDNSQSIFGSKKKRE